MCTGGVPVPSIRLGHAVRSPPAPVCDGGERVTLSEHVGRAGPAEGVERNDADPGTRLDVTKPVCQCGSVEERSPVPDSVRSREEESCPRQDKWGRGAVDAPNRGGSLLLREDTDARRGWVRGDPDVGGSQFGSLSRPEPKAEGQDCEAQEGDFGVAEGP